MRKLLLHILPVLAILSGCTNKEKMALDTCSFDVRVQKVGGTKVWFSITPSNPYAYYAFGLVSSYSDVYDASMAELSQMQIEWMRQVYDNYVYSEEDVPGFSDVFLYRGPREMRETLLARDTDHKLVVMQVDPVKRTVIGETAMVIFHTLPVEDVDLGFSLSFAADTLRITPSDNSLSYYWDYDSTELMYQEYLTPQYYFYFLADMYESYDFMGNLLNRGPVEWVFSRDDKTIEEGGQYTLLIAGYADGEYNTAYTRVDFIYHKDRPIEVLSISDED